ncbi:hemerythrin domain-containing protein [Hydrogenophaga sp.]|uniref:hemerythrin domain-containing protein n=1 Tax=Hydrogenophaga sp. TaxID=1904254 RepID=UPI003F6F0378
MRQTIRVITSEHAALATLLRSVLELLEQHREAESMPDFDTLRATLFYLDDFPEKQHHRRESEILFPKLRARAPQERELLDRLDYEHERGGRKIRDVEHALLAFEMLGTRRRRAFEAAMKAYADFYVEHMRLEEQIVLPLAERVLTEEDWADLDEAFGSIGQSPMNAALAEDYGTLLRRMGTRVVNGEIDAEKRS